MAHLEKKYDDTMTEYYRAFCAMLKRTCGVKLTAEEGTYCPCCNMILLFEEITNFLPSTFL